MFFFKRTIEVLGPVKIPSRREDTLQGTNIAPKNDQKWHFEDDFPFPKVGYVNFVEGKLSRKMEDDFGKFSSEAGIPLTSLGMRRMRKSVWCCNVLGIPQAGILLCFYYYFFIFFVFGQLPTKKQGDV